MKSIETEDSLGTSHSDLRLYARFECIEVARLESDGSDKVYSARIVDIGLGGVQIHSGETIPTDELLTLRIEQGGKVVLRVPGKARYCTSTEDGAAYVSGFKFAPETHQDRVSIAEFVHGIFQRQWEILAS